MGKADLGLEPKRNGIFVGDAMSTKILEFMSLGVPVIASDTRVHRHYFDTRVLEFFNSGDEKDLARAILKLATDEDYRKHLAKAGAEFAEDFSWEEKKSGYLRLVDRLVEPSITARRRPNKESMKSKPETRQDTRTSTQIRYRRRTT